MSDNDDAHSEVAPEGWGAMYNNLMSPGKNRSASSKSSLTGRSGKLANAAATGWLGGWFASSSPQKKETKENEGSEPSESADGSESHRDSISSEEPDGTHQESFHESELDEAEGTSDVDSDGFPVDPGDEVDALLKATSSDSASNRQESMSDQIPPELSARYSVGDVGAMMEPGLLRRERIRNRQQYLSTAAAAEVALPEESLPEVSSASSKKAEDPPTGAIGGFWTSLFGASTSAAAPTISADPQQQDKDTTQEPSNPVVPTEKPATPSQNARNLLPPLPDPPEFQVNSFLMSPGGSFFQPADQPPVLRFQGRLRGLPRQIAPYWSTQNPNSAVKAPDYRMKTNNPSSTLYMFRVS